MQGDPFLRAKMTVLAFLIVAVFCFCFFNLELQM